MKINTKEYRDYVNKKIEEYNNNKKDTILFFVDTYFPIIDGVVNVVHNYSKLAMKDFNVIVCTPAFKNEIVTQDYLVLACKSLYLKFLGYSMALPNQDIFFKNQLNKIKKIKIIHMHSPFIMGDLALKYSKKHNIPIVSTFHSKYKVDIKKNSKLNWITSIILNIIISRFNKCQKIYTMNESCKKVAISYGVKNDFIFIPNGCSHALVKNNFKKEEEIKNKYKISKNKHILISVCRLVKVKNIYFTLKVIKELKERGLDFQFIFVGDGPEQKRMKKIIKKYKIEEYTSLIGKISDLDELMRIYKLADLLVLPSEYDTQSLTISEAASQKTPSIVIKDSVTSYFIKDRINGFTEVEDAKIFADKIIYSLTHIDNLAAIKNNAMKDLVFSWNDIWNQVKESYLEIIRNWNYNK